MFRGVYDGVEGMVRAQSLYEVTSSNLANIRVAGHRARRLVFQFDPGMGPATAPAGQRQLIASFEPGPLEYTGAPTHVAIKGDGFFVVNTPRGEFYTRSGAFQIGPNGSLQLGDGHEVQGVGGPIVIPPGAGQVQIGEHGEVFAGGVIVGQLRVVRFDDPTLLRPATANLFEAPPGVIPIDVAVPELVPGAVESSNVNPVTELVNLIIASRYYEASQRAVLALDEAMRDASTVA